MAEVGKLLQKYIQKEKQYTKLYQNAEYTKYKTNIQKKKNQI